MLDLVDKYADKGAIRALVLDDNSFDRARIRRLGDRSTLRLVIDEASSISEMEQCLTDKAYDLILLDFLLPSGTGIEAMKCIKAAPHNRDAAMVMISGQAGMATAVEAMQNGCHDVVDKEVLTPERLCQSVTTALLAAKNQRELCRKAQANERQTQMSIPNSGQGVEIKTLSVLIAGLDEDDEFVFH